MNPTVTQRRLKKLSEDPKSTVKHCAELLQALHESSVTPISQRQHDRLNHALQSILNHENVTRKNELFPGHAALVSVMRRAMYAMSRTSLHVHEPIHEAQKVLSGEWHKVLPERIELFIGHCVTAMYDERDHAETIAYPQAQFCY